MTLEQLIHAAILRADLSAVDSYFSTIGIKDITGLVHLKTALVALANVADLEPTLRLSYKSFAEPSLIIKNHKKSLDFSKYLRNKVVAHIHPQLIAKAIEWQPILRQVASDLSSSESEVMINVWLLETAINTYVDENGDHKVFDGETDLMYPPDWTRFLDYLSTTITGSCSYLNSLIEFWGPKLAIPDDQRIGLELALKAAKTEFKFLAH